LFGRQEGHPACKQTGCWFVGGDDLTGDLHDLQLQLSPPLPSSLAAIKPANPGSLGKMAVELVREGWYYYICVVGKTTLQIHVLRMVFAECFIIHVHARS